MNNNRCLIVRYFLVFGLSLVGVFFLCPLTSLATTKTNNIITTDQTGQQQNMANISNSLLLNSSPSQQVHNNSSLSKSNKNKKKEKEKIIEETESETNSAEKFSREKEYFVKIYNRIVPIEPTSFSREKTIVVFQPNTSFANTPTVENINLCFAENEINDHPWNICQLTHNLSNKLQISKKRNFQINLEEAEKYLKELQHSTKKEPRNAKLGANENNKIIVKEKEEWGYEIDLEKTMANLKKYMDTLSTKGLVELPTKIVKPIITADNYRQMGIKEKIGSGQSNFRGSPKNRIHNIHVATERFNGVLVPPQATFSFIKILGEVNAKTGYKPELVIKNHQTIPEFGGGVCQVSTTLFRAAVNSGLKITERRNHAYPVQYYSPQGTDATVYIPKPDLQFINNTPGYILIQPHFSGTILTFDIFGDSNGRQVETEGPTLIKRTPDGGRKYVWWQIIKDKNGNVIEKNGFWSFYHNAASYHHNSQPTFTKKPKDWSGKQWQKYKRDHGL